MENSNVGVVTKTEVVKVDNGYVIAYTILKPDGTETTIYGGNPADHYKAWEYQSAAEGMLSGGSSTSAMDASYKDTNVLYPRKDTLVKYTAMSSGYYQVAAANGAMNQDTDGKVLAGDAETIKSSGGTYLVNADTVFFIAQYVPDNTTTDVKNDWTLTGYKVVKDFRDIQDLCLNADGDVFAKDALGYAVTRTSPYNLRLTWFNGERTSDGFLKYVLVTFATDQHDKATVPVAKYAYIKTTTVNVAVTSDYAVFPAIINGVETTLTVQYADYELIRANGPGLYKYTETGNNYVKIDTTAGRLNATNMTAKDLYKYGAGVLTTYASGNVSKGDQGGATNYRTVAKNVQVYLVNPTTGSSITASLSALSTSVYGKDCPIWYQTDEYGWINYIYIEDTRPVVAGPNLDKPTPVADSRYMNSFGANSPITVTASGTTVIVDVDQHAFDQWLSNISNAAAITRMKRSGTNDLVIGVKIPIPTAYIGGESGIYITTNDNTTPRAITVAQDVEDGCVVMYLKVGYYNANDVYSWSTDFTRMLSIDWAGATPFDADVTYMNFN